MNREYLEKQVEEWAKSGQDYESIRAQLAKKGLSREEQKSLLKLADQHILQYELAHQHRNKAIIRMILGAAMLLLGLGITFGSRALGGSSYYVAYGSMLTGAWILWKGYQVYKAPPPQVRPADLLRKRKRFERF